MRKLWFRMLNTIHTCLGERQFISACQLWKANDQNWRFRAWLCSCNHDREEQSEPANVPQKQVLEQQSQQVHSETYTIGSQHSHHYVQLTISMTIRIVSLHHEENACLWRSCRHCCTQIDCHYSGKYLRSHNNTQVQNIEAEREQVTIHWRDTFVTV